METTTESTLENTKAWLNAVLAELGRGTLGMSFCSVGWVLEWKDAGRTEAEMIVVRTEDARAVAARLRGE